MESGKKLDLVRKILIRCEEMRSKSWNVINVANFMQHNSECSLPSNDESEGYKVFALSLQYSST